MSSVRTHNHQPDILKLTPAAEERMRVCLTKQPECKAIRLSVEKKGCSGWGYVMDYVAAPQEGDIVLPFLESYSICIDKRSYPYLKGITIDFIKQDLNQKFIFENPNQTGQCGCGKSFTVEPEHQKE